MKCKTKLTCLQTFWETMYLKVGIINFLCPRLMCSFLLETFFNSFFFYFAKSQKDSRLKFALFLSYSQFVEKISNQNVVTLSQALFLGRRLSCKSYLRTHSWYVTIVEPYQLLCYWSNFSKLLLAGWFEIQPQFHSAKLLMI